MNSAQKLVERLTEKNLTLGSVESFTGGLFAKTITDISGASKTFKGALVTYSKELKENLLKIPADYINEHGVVSYEVCQQMAIKGQKALGVDVCVAFTGNAGPEVNEEKGTVGEIYIAIVYKGQVWPIPLHLELGREENREYSVQAAINALLSII